MVIIDEQVMKSTKDKTEQIAHKPVLFRVRPDGTRDYSTEKEALSSDGQPYVGPLEFVVQPNLREIAGNKAFEYLQGKRYYDLRGKTGTLEDTDESNNSNGLFNIGKWFLLALAVSGVALLVTLHFFPGK
jgi:hypothetical protein